MIAQLAPILVFLLILGPIGTLARGQSGWVLWVKATGFSPHFVWVCCGSCSCSIGAEAWVSGRSH